MHSVIQTAFPTNLHFSWKNVMKLQLISAKYGAWVKNDITTYHKKQQQQQQHMRKKYQKQKK